MMIPDGTCKLVMSALTQRIEKASSTFSNVYGLSGNVVAGRTISLIQVLGCLRCDSVPREYATHDFDDSSF
jgi:hypothetical protein